MRTLYNIISLLGIGVLFFFTGCKKNDPSPTYVAPNNSGSISMLVNGVNWETTLKPDSTPDVSVRQTKTGLEITGRRIIGTDTTLAYLFLKDYSGNARRYIINPQDTLAFPDTAGNFAFYGPQSIIKRKKPSLTLFGTNGVVTLDATSNKKLTGIFDIQVTINDPNNPFTITNGRINAITLP